MTDDDDRIERGPFKGWHEWQLGCFVWVVVAVAGAFFVAGLIMRSMPP